MSKKFLLISVLVVLAIGLVIGVKFMDGGPSSTGKTEKTVGMIVQPVEVSKEEAMEETIVENIADFVDNDAHISFVGFDNSYIYLVDGHAGTYLPTKDLTSGINSGVQMLPQEFRGGIDYLAHNNKHGYFYAIYDTYYYQMKYLEKDVYQKFTLHEKFRGGDYYFTANGCIYMITPDKMSVRRTTDLSTAADYYEFALPAAARDGDDYFGWNHRFYVVDLPSDVVRSYTSLETLAEPQEDIYSEAIQDYLPYRNYTGHWEKVWDYKDVTSQQEVTTTYQFGVEMSDDRWASHQPATTDEIKRAQVHFYLSKMGKSLQTAAEIWTPVHEVQQKDTINPAQHLTKWQWIIRYDNYRQSKEYKVYTKIFKQTHGEIPNIPLKSTLHIPPVAALPSGKPDNGTVQLSWHTAHEKGSSQLFKYKIYRSEFKDGDLTLLTENPIGGNSYVDTTVEDEKIYYYWLRTVNEQGVMSPYSEPSQPVYVDTKNKIAFLATNDKIKTPEFDEDAQSQPESGIKHADGSVSYVESEATLYGNDGVNIFKLFQSNADGSNQGLVVGGYVGTYKYSPDGHRIAYTMKDVQDGQLYLGFKEVNENKFWQPERYEDYPDISNLYWVDDTLLKFLSQGKFVYYNNNGFGNLGNLSIYRFIMGSYRTVFIYDVKYNRDLKKMVLERGIYNGTQDSLPIIDDNVQYDTTVTASFYNKLLFYNAKKDGDYDIYGYSFPNQSSQEYFSGTDNDVDDKFPVISPDGTKVAYLSKIKPSNWALCVMDIVYDHKNKYGDNIGSSTSNQKILVENVEFAEPVWMPNSKALIYSAMKPVLGNSYLKFNLDTYLYLYSLDHQASVQISQVNQKNKLPQVLPLRYEAEDALIHNAEIQPLQEASDLYKVGKIQSEDSYVEFTVHVPVEHVDYKVYVGYFNGSSEESSHIIEVADVRPFQITYKNGGENQLQVVEFSVPLKAGENKIRFRKGENFADIDYITVVGQAEK